MSDTTSHILVRCLNNIWFLVLRLSLLVAISWVVNTSFRSTVSSFTVVGTLIVDVAATVQMTILLYSVYLVGTQLSQKVQHNEYLFYEQQMSTAVYFLVIILLFELLISAIWYMIAIKYETTMKWVAIDIFEQICVSISTCSFLTITLYFVIVDAKICNNLVEKLLLHASNHTLTMTVFNINKKLITERIKKTKLINTLRILVAMLYILVIIIFVFIIGGSYAIELSLYIVAASIKELIFVTVIFLHVAKVNESADKLAKLLGNGKKYCFECSSSFVRM